MVDVCAVIILAVLDAFGTVSLVMLPCILIETLFVGSAILPLALVNRVPMLGAVLLGIYCPFFASAEVVLFLVLVVAGAAKLPPLNEILHRQHVPALPAGLEFFSSHDSPRKPRMNAIYSVSDIY